MVQVHALCGGYLDLDQTVFFPDRPPGTRWTVPIPCWLVAHPRGRLLFDTGIHRDATVDPVGRLGDYGLEPVHSCLKGRHIDRRVGVSRIVVHSGVDDQRARQKIGGRHLNKVQ